MVESRCERCGKHYEEIVRSALEAHRAGCELRTEVGVDDGLGGVQQADGFAAGWKSLTTREEEVLALLLTGQSTRGIADKLFISRHTVTFHVKKLMQKFAAPSRVALVARAAMQGRPPAEAVPERLTTPSGGPGL